MAWTVLVLGAGVGGVTVAMGLRRRLGENHRILLVDRSARHAFAPSFPWLIVGRREPAQVCRDLHALEGQGITFVEAEVRAVDPEARRAETSAGDLAGDVLVVALGAEPAPETVPGLAESAHGFYDLEGACRLRDAARDFPGGRVAVVIAGLPFKCPAAPYEAALLLQDSFLRRGLSGKVGVSVFTPEPLPMPTAGPALGRAVRAFLEERGIAFHPGRRLVAVEASGRRLVFEDGERAACDLLVAVPPHRAPAAVRRSALAGPNGWIPVDPGTLETRFPGVYALGDAAAVALPGRFRPDAPLSLPKAGVFAHAQGEVVAANVADRLAGREPRARFDGAGACFVELGGNRAGFASGDFFAQPAPAVVMERPGRLWHLGKVLFERYWLASLGGGRWAGIAGRGGEWLLDRRWLWRWF